MAITWDNAIKKRREKKRTLCKDNGRWSNQERILNREEIIWCANHLLLCVFVNTKIHVTLWKQGLRNGSKLKTFYPSRIRKHIKWLLESMCEVKPCWTGRLSWSANRQATYGRSRQHQFFGRRGTVQWRHTWIYTSKGLLSTPSLLLHRNPPVQKNKQEII